MRSLSGVTWHLGNKNNRKVEQIELERVIGKIQSTLPVYIKDIWNPKLWQLDFLDSGKKQRFL